MNKEKMIEKLKDLRQFAGYPCNGLNCGCDDTVGSECRDRQVVNLVYPVISALQSSVVLTKEEAKSIIEQDCKCLETEKCHDCLWYESARKSISSQLVEIAKNE